MVRCAKCAWRVLMCAALVLTIGTGALAQPEGMIAGWGNGIYGMAHIAPGNDFVAVTGGDAHLVALRADGTLAAWGDNTNGQTAVPAGTFVSIAARRNYSLALRSDGTIAAWGLDDYGQVSGTPTGDGFVAIGAGFRHGLALHADGHLVVWGFGDNLQKVHTDIPAVDEDNPFVSIAANGWHNLALRADGSIVAWGYDGYGQVSNTPAGTGFVAVAAGGWHSIALRADGSLTAWGLNSDGRTNVPAGNNFVAIAGGEYNSMALTSGGAVVEWPEPFNDPTLLQDSFVALSGSAHRLAIAAEDPFDYSRPTDPTGRWVPVAEGLRDTTTGLVWGFGEDEVSTYLRGHGMNMSWDFAQSLPILAPDGSVSGYLQFSNAFFGRQDTDWRLPTIDEMRAAHQAGLINYLDGSPRPGFQRLGTGFGGADPSVSAECWSSTSTGKYVRLSTGERFTIGWWLDFKTGLSDKLAYYKFNYVPVRGALPPSKGKGK